MAELKCCHDGCTAVFTTNEPLHPDAKYTCRNHTEKAPKTAHFQKYARDRTIDRKGHTEE